MCDSFSNFLEFDTGGRRNVQILLRNVKKLACGTCKRICPLLQNVHTMNLWKENKISPSDFSSKSTCSEVKSSSYSKRFLKKKMLWNKVNVIHVEGMYLTLIWLVGFCGFLAFVVFYFWIYMHFFVRGIDICFQKVSQLALFWALKTVFQDTCWNLFSHYIYLICASPRFPWLSRFCASTYVPYIWSQDACCPV